MYENPLSPSSINRYLGCPYSFFLRYFRRIRTGQDVSAMFGSAVHKVGEMYWIEYQRWNDVEKALQASITAHCPTLPSEYTDAAHDCFNNFQAIVALNPTMVPTYTELKVENSKNNTVAIIDVVYPHKIVDYKTSTQYTIKPKQPNVIQAAMCSMNLKEVMGLEVTNVEFQYLRFKKYQYVDVTPTVEENVTELINDVRDGIDSNTFPKNKKSCFFCDYSLICRKEDEMIKRSEKCSNLAKRSLQTTLELVV